MAVRQITMVNGRALAGAMWILESVGHGSELGQLQDGPLSAGTVEVAPDVEQDMIAWARTYGTAMPADVGTLETSTPGIEDNPVLREYVARKRDALDLWLNGCRRRSKTGQLRRLKSEHSTMGE